MAAGAVPDAGAEAADGDARVLRIVRGAGGRRRDWASVVQDCEEEPFEDFPLSGPRTTGWCLGFLKRRVTPVDHHLMFRTSCKLQPDAWGMGEHEQLMRLLELGGEYDQLDLCNCAWAEAVV